MIKNEKIHKKKYKISDVVRQVLKNSNMKYSEANDRMIRRITHSIFNFLNTSEKDKITSQNFDTTVAMVTELFLDSNSRTYFNKMSKREELEIEELDYLIDTFAKAYSNSEGEEEGQRFREYLDTTKGDHFWEGTEIFRRVLNTEYDNIIKSLADLINPQARDEIFQETIFQFLHLINHINDKINEADNIDMNDKDAIIRQFNKLVKNITVGIEHDMDKLIEHEELDV